MKKYSILAILMALVVITTSCTGITSTDSNNNVIDNGNVAVTNDKLNDTSIPKDSTSLIPEGWHILERSEKQEKVEGDLNKDGIADIAAVIQETNSHEGEAPNRSLLIAFGNKAETYELSVIAEKAILKADEGGVWGDPLEGISIDRGSILVNFYGGSNWRWFGNYRFRYQDNDWYLIGATTGSFHTSTNEYTEEKDYNLLTGDFILKKVDESGKLHTTSSNVGKRDLLKLTDFVAADSENQIYMPEIENNDSDTDKTELGIDTMEMLFILNKSLLDADILNLLGGPETKSEPLIWGSDGLEHQAWYYTSKGIELGFVKNDQNEQLVFSVKLTSPCSLKTSRSIGIGSTKDAVLEAYELEINPEENIAGSSEIVVGSVYQGLIFTFKDDLVDSIFIGPAAE